MSGRSGLNRLGAISAFFIGTALSVAIVASATSRWGFWGLAGGVYVGMSVLGLPLFAFSALADGRTGRRRAKYPVGAVASEA